MSQRCPTCGSEEACWNAAEAFGMDDIHLSPYPSQTAMAAAVELEVHAALGQVQTQTIGKVIQNAIDKAIEKYDRNLKDRDAFIGNEGLWDKFVAQLPRS